jgi:hypothetical protein
MKQIKSPILILSTGRSLKADFSRVIKRFALLLTALFALQNIALAATVTILPSPPGAKRSASEGQSGYATENFDSFATGSIASGNTISTAIATGWPRVQVYRWVMAAAMPYWTINLQQQELTAPLRLP